MFAVLNILENEKGILNRLKYLFNPPQPHLEKISVKDGAPFYYLEIFENKCGIDFEQVSYLLGRCAKFIIPCCKINFESTSLISEFKPTKLPRIMLVNSALDFINSMTYNKNGFSIGFIDLQGAYRDYIVNFVSLASSIRVVTDNPRKYETLSDELYCEWGLSLIVSTDMKCADACDVIISPDSCENEYYNCCVLLRDRQTGELRRLKPGSFELPDEYKKLMPQSVNELLFASALYELCGVRRLSNLRYTQLVTASNN